MGRRGRGLGRITREVWAASEQEVERVEIGGWRELTPAWREEGRRVEGWRVEGWSKWRRRGASQSRRSPA
jgi:hypothetical protein